MERQETPLNNTCPSVSSGNFLRFRDKNDYKSPHMQFTHTLAKQLYCPDGGQCCGEVVILRMGQGGGTEGEVRFSEEGFFGGV